MLKFSHEIEPHEILLDQLAKEKEEILGLSEKKFEPPLFKKNIFFLFFLFFLFIFILYVRTFYLQIVRGKELEEKARANKFIFSKIQAERGVIYDRNFEQLVFNVPQFNLILKKEKLPRDEKEKNKILNEISKILDLRIEDINEKLNSPEEEIKISENLDYKKLLILETKIDEFVGFEIQSQSKRNYPEGEIFAPILGYLGKIEPEEYQTEKEFYSISDLIGKTGIEKSYEKFLRKNPGKILIERDARGRIISEKLFELPQSGKSLVLYLDANLQRKIKEELEKKMREVGARGGAAVALDPRTGGVLALVSLPSFDNNFPEKFLNNPQNPLFNRAVSGQYLLGSTIKPFIALAALEEKIISPQKKINCQGKIEIPHRYQPEKIYTFGDWTIHGLTDLKKAIAESCNVFFYTVGGGYKEQEGLGPQRIKKYLQLFGFGEIVETDFPLPSFARGNLPDPEWKKREIGENWWDGDTYNLSIGQGYILATPLQVAKAFVALANGGKLLKPRFVWKIVDEQKNTLEEFSAEVEKENFLDEKNIQIVREGMRWAVSGQNSPLASAIALNDLPVAVAAKTGTAQVPRKDCPDCFNIWISLFAPYENPEIVLVLVLEDVRGRLSQVVVPVAKEILNWYFTR